MINLTELKNELESDPTGRGYASHLAAGTFTPIVALLNEVQAGISVFRGVIPSHEIVDATDPGEWGALSAAERTRYQTITGAGQVNTASANVRSAFLAMFAVGTTTRAALTALATRPGSRAEQLFGVGVVVTAEECIAAMAPPSEA